MKDPHDIIIRPVVSEKTYVAVEDRNTYTFIVHSSASKPEIKSAVESLFGVKVKAVNTTITKGKVKRFRGRPGRRNDVKKAYVTLEDGNAIDVTTGL